MALAGGQPQEYAAQLARAQDKHVRSAEPELHVSFLLQGSKLTSLGHPQGVAPPGAHFPAPLSATARARLSPAVFDPEPAFVPPVVQVRYLVCLCSLDAGHRTEVPVCACRGAKRAFIQCQSPVGDVGQRMVPALVL